MFAEYSRYDATGLAALIARGEVSASEVLEAALACAAQVNPALAAICLPMEKIARERTRGPLTT